MASSTAMGGTSGSTGSTGIPLKPAGGGGKKKFGQNLNKLIQPDQDKVPTASTKVSPHNGLLLLSSVKSKSAASTTGSTNNNWSPSAAVKKKEPSQHDALLSAIGGVRKAESTPDAWGIASNKQHPPQEIVSPSSNLVSANTGMNSSNFETITPPAETEKATAVFNQPKKTESQVNSPQAPPASDPTPSSDPAPSGPGWDEYGGRGGASGTIINTLGVETKDYMSQRAKERANQLEREEAARVKLAKERAASKLRELDTKAAAAETTLEREKQTPAAPPVKQLWEDKKQPFAVASAASPLAQPAVPLIHLNSYEDRSRGEQPPAARMLYDPKSGKMVELKEATKKTSTSVKTRGTNTSNSAAKTARKNDTESTAAAAKSRAGTRRGGGRGGTKSSDVVDVVVVKPNDEKAAAATANNSKRGKRVGRPSTASTNTESAVVAATPKPTAARSRGGRGKKPSGKKVDQDVGQGNVNNEHYLLHPPASGVTLFTGFHVPEHVGMQTPAVASIHSKPAPPVVFKVVKADDKMDLLADVDNDEILAMLKPTAPEFAPSQAALAAAQAARAAVHSDEDDDDEHGSDILDDDDDDGLGFDPATDMNGLIQSPAIAKPSSVDLDLVALHLNPPLKADGPRHIFDFGSSGTWGGAQQSASDWEIPIGGRPATTVRGGLFGGETFGESSRGGGSSAVNNSWAGLPSSNTQTTD